MKFRKIEVNNVPKSGTVQSWYLIIDNQTDLITYLKIDTEFLWRSIESMMRDDSDGKGNIRLDHLSAHREVHISYVIKNKLLSSEQSSEVTPVDVITSITTNKLENLLKILSSGDSIQIGMSGGYSNLSSFDEIWKPTILEKIEKDDCVFPIDKSPIIANVLIIENGSSIGKDVYNFADKLCDKAKKEIPKTIKELKMKDSKWIASSIASSNKIVLKTNLVDNYQLDEFMKLFSVLPSKEIYIKTYNVEKLKEHTLWNLNNDKHKIVFF